MRAPGRPGREEEAEVGAARGASARVGGAEAWTPAMEGSDEPLLDAKAQVSPGRGQPGKRALVRDRSFPKLSFPLPFQVTNQVSEWRPRPVLAGPRGSGTGRSWRAFGGGKPGPVSLPQLPPSPRPVCASPSRSSPHRALPALPLPLHLRW